MGYLSQLRSDTAKLLDADDLLQHLLDLGYPHEVAEALLSSRGVALAAEHRKRKP